MEKTLGLLTVGQSPRADVLPLLQDILGPTVTLKEKGALDGVTPVELAAMAPPPGAYPIVTRLADGSQTIVTKQSLVPMINAKLRELKEEGTSIIALLCTGQFPPLEVPPGIFLLRAQSVVDNTIAALVTKSMRLGILVPLEDQKAHALELYPDLVADTVAAAASPYGSDETIREAAGTFKDVDMVIMHCMGYTRKHRALVQEVSGKPVMQANAIVARIAAELLGA